MQVKEYLLKMYGINNFLEEYKIRFPSIECMKYKISVSPESEEYINLYVNDEIMREQISSIDYNCYPIIYTNMAKIKLKNYHDDVSCVTIYQLRNIILSELIFYKRKLNNDSCSQNKKL